MTIGSNTSSGLIARIDTNSGIFLSPMRVPKAVVPMKASSAIFVYNPAGCLSTLLTGNACRGSQFSRRSPDHTAGSAGLPNKYAVFFYKNTYITSVDLIKVLLAPRRKHSHLKFRINSVFFFFFIVIENAIVESEKISISSLPFAIVHTWTNFCKIIFIYCFHCNMLLKKFDLPRKSCSV